MAASAQASVTVRRAADLAAPDARAPGRCYIGERCSAGCRVVVVDADDTRSLRARTRDPLWSFSWGRRGASARELAWAILYDSTGEVTLADDWCAAFTSDVIAGLAHAGFRLEMSDVLRWLDCDLAAGGVGGMERIGFELCPVVDAGPPAPPQQQMQASPRRSRLELVRATTSPTAPCDSGGGGLAANATDTR
jgi:hypothetical protein